MPEGYLNITYKFGEVYTKENALLRISQAETYFASLAQIGVKIDEALAYLDLASEALENGLFREAVELADEAIDIAESIEALAESVLQKINVTENLINEYERSGNQRIAQQAKNELDKAKESYSEGNYQLSETHSNEAQRIILESNKLPFTSLQVITAIITLILSIVILANREEIKRIMIRQESVISDEKYLQKIFDEKPHLREEDREIIKYVLETGGTFITDIRKKFDLPKSSGWRMLRRLEDEGVIETELVGRETYVKVKKSR
jgi:uncharacterized membrane protein